MPTSFEKRIATGTDDCYLWEGDSHWYDETEVIVGSWWSRCDARFRFTVPIAGSGQTVVSAKLHLYMAEDLKFPSNAVTISMAKELNPASPQTPAAWTTATVSWTLPSPQAPNVWIYTPELATILTEVINQAGFTAGNAIVVRMYGYESTGGESDNLYVVAYDKVPGSAPSLEVTYSDRAGGGMM